MKKLIAFLLVFVLIVGIFAGCTGPDSNPTNGTDPGSQTAPPTTPDPTDPPTDPDPTDAPTDPDPTDAPTDPDPTDAPTDATDVPTDPEPTDAPTDPTDPTQDTTPHNHTYSDWTVIKQPTCTQSGERCCSCSCGDSLTEEIPASGHNYVDSVCTTCGNENFSKELLVLDGLKADTMYYCSDKAIVFKDGEKCYLADRSGNVLTEGYDYVTCANADHLFVAYNFASEVIGKVDDPDYDDLEITRCVYDCYLINEQGTVIYQTQYIYVEEPMYTTTYEGEYIAYCNENRIITYTSETYRFGSDHASITVYINDLQGNRLAEFPEVKEVGTLINGKLVMIMDYYNDEYDVLLVVDENGNVLQTSYDYKPEFWYSVAFPSQQWAFNGFADGYLMLTESWGDGALLISEDLSTSYMLHGAYLASYTNCGTIVASKIVMDNALTAEYYLIDLAKCATDEDGYIIPTLDAAVYKQGYSSVSISSLFGDIEPYALVSRNDQWGYLALDGSLEKMYDDAGSFFNGKAIVKDGDRIYVIDRNFKQISNSITGYPGVSSAAGDVFCLKDGDKLQIAVCTG